jgi:hypothetical protein
VAASENLEFAGFQFQYNGARDSLREAAMCARHQNSISYSHALKASLFSLESIVERRYNWRPLASD